MNWFRVHHGMWSDPKLALIARRSGASVPLVIAVWSALLDCASQARPRGTVGGFDAESVALALGCETEEVEVIVEAMCAKGMIEGEWIARWVERQYDKPSDAPEATAERKRQQRARARTPENEGVTVEPVTPCHAESRPVTPHKQNRTEQTTTPKPPQATPAPTATEAVVVGESAEGKPETVPTAPWPVAVQEALAKCPPHWEPRLRVLVETTEIRATVAQFALGMIRKWRSGEDPPPPPAAPPSPPRELRPAPPNLRTIRPDAPILTMDPNLRRRLMLEAAEEETPPCNPS